MNGSKLNSVLIVLLAGTLVAGCSNDMGDLEDWIAEVKQRRGGRIEPLPQVKPYETYRYSADNLRSPFTPGASQDRVATGPRPDDTRNKEYLEQFPLDTLKMVGTLDREGRVYGLVQTQDGLVHRVLPGNHLGQNDGRVVAVTASEIALEELVPDGIGGFYKRPAAIGLGE